ncbi:P-loop NTPase family protein [Saccharolobus shibatae]|uniref:AAA family ATPase n=1 Tax=Saccharolobus shibatae TaxID=2286 RepID=UPI001C44F700|nr:AAA family ATPase [Saccharolobus shibatae]
MNLSTFVFERGNLVSIYGESGVGKTSLSLELALQIRTSVFISTEGSLFEARLEKIKVGQGVYFASVKSNIELFNGIINSLEYKPSLIVVDAINTFHRYERNVHSFLKLLIILRSIAQSNVKILLVWEVSANNKVAGEKFMRKFSDDVLRITKSYIIGNLRRCKFKITERGVIGCL